MSSFCDGAKRVLIKLSRSGHCENLEDWSLLRDDVLEMAEGIYGDLVTREEALELVAKEILESERPEFMDLVLTLNPRDPISDKKLSAKKSGEVLLSKSEDLMSEATHKDDPLLGKSRFFAISAREISGNPAKDQLRWLDAIELAQELGCTIMPIAIKFADHEQLLHDLVHIGANYKLGKKLAKLAVLLEITTPVATALSLCALAALNHNDDVYLGKYIGEVIRKTKGLAVVHELCMRIILKEEYVVPVDMADIYSCAMNNCNEKNMMETLDAIAENERILAENAEKHRKSAENLPICQLFTPDSMYCTVDCYKSKNIPKLDPKLYKKSGNLKKLMAYESSSLAMCLSLFQAENLAENQEFWTENEKLKRYEKSLRFFAGKGVPMEILTKIAPMKVINAANQNDRSLTAIDRIEDYGCDKNRFIGDRQYRDDAIVGLAMTENDQQFQDAIELAQKYEIDDWQLHMASLENAISMLPIPEVKQIIKNRQHLVKLRQNLDLFHSTLRHAVLPLLGTNEQFFAYCSLFSEQEVEKKAVGVVRKIVEKRKEARAPKMWQDAKYLAGILIGIPDKILWSIVEMVQLIPVGKVACEIAARELLDGNEVRPPGHPLTIWLLVGEDLEEFVEIVAVKAREDEIAYLKNALILLEATPKTPKILIEALKDRVEKMERSTISPENQGFGAQNETGMKMRRKN
ncbi:unnamed protein product [Caenorhabditis angaria]|uniref:Uncharacterized protein n=1 Tax=Caenorhabditis angaria TaxID=860376 RepID=A0A9P1I8Z3_9PELO|nr:unnamed protein product [Caenorhabditis angaria]